MINFAGMNVCSGSFATRLRVPKIGLCPLFPENGAKSEPSTGVLCDPNCNIRVDLVFLFPILGLATYCAYQSYMGRPSPRKVVGIVLGVIGLVVFSLVAEGYGYGALASVVTLGALALGVVYAMKSRSKTNRT
ncbi:MAG: hypothetical protein K2Y71_13175 [Xanthobacteraceae bacterium]|nr:hypothetical protein [Xanthobacteraceae bacterium]